MKDRKELKEENTKLLAEVAGYKHDLMGIRDALDEDGGFKNTVNGINENLIPNKKADAILELIEKAKHVVNSNRSNLEEDINDLAETLSKLEGETG